MVTTEAALRGIATLLGVDPTGKSIQEFLAECAALGPIGGRYSQINLTSVTADLAAVPSGSLLIGDVNAIGTLLPVAPETGYWFDFVQQANAEVSFDSGAGSTISYFGGRSQAILAQNNARASCRFVYAGANSWEVLFESSGGVWLTPT